MIIVMVIVIYLCDHIIKIIFKIISHANAYHFTVDTNTVNIIYYILILITSIYKII